MIDITDRLPVIGGAAPADLELAPVDQQVELIAAAIEHRTPGRYERFVKPLVDKLAATLLLLVLLPAMLLIALAVVVTMGRPVLFGQTRTGQHGRAFSMLKFRTMLPDRRKSQRHFDGPDRRITHKTPNDPRHTKVGRVLRKLSLDELPQLVNVIRGDMSLVGPRPEIAALADKFSGWQHARHTIKPGVTGLWQTTARGEGQLLHECVEIDLRYIRDISFRTDVSILLRTPIALVRNKGVI